MGVCGGPGQRTGQPSRYLFYDRLVNVLDNNYAMCNKQRTWSSKFEVQAIVFFFFIPTYLPMFSYFIEFQRPR